MSTTIKEYKELCYITTFDNEVYVMADETIDSLEKKLGSRLLNVGSGFIATSSIKKVEIKSADDVDNRIIQIQDPDLKERVRAELRKRQADGYTTNLWILENIIDRLSKKPN